VKADGLAAGKGVYVCQTEAEAVQAIDQIMGEKKFGESGNRVVIEELLTGQEVSYLAFTDGKTLLPIGSAQDHKAIFDGDRGPNTGGMGAYSPPPIFTGALEQEVMETIMQPTVDAMREEGRPYKGVLYAGLMLTNDGPRVLEFNARFGDPETQVLMARLEGDIVPVMQACAQTNQLQNCKVTWHSKAGVCVVMAAGGYPGSYEKGKEISGLDAAASSNDVTVFHAGTRLVNGRVLTHGGRVLGVTALGKDIRGAIDNAYSAVGKIQWEGVYYRKDIGKKALDL
jgi:phosphoribosylamine--glycine ligase